MWCIVGQDNVVWKHEGDCDKQDCEEKNSLLSEAAGGGEDEGVGRQCRTGE